MVYRPILAISITFLLGLLTVNVVSNQDVAQSVTTALPSVELMVNEKQSSAHNPVVLKIPKINVDTQVEHVGLTPDGAVDVPVGRTNVAWFVQSSIPGEVGVSIIDGHFGWKDNLSAVFDDLHTLHKGDVIYVEDESGRSTTFVVTRTKIYNKGENASAIFESNDNKSHLVLITCQGAWDKTLKGYSGRFVVFADRDAQ